MKSLIFVRQVVYFIAQPEIGFSKGPVYVIYNSIRKLHVRFTTVHSENPKILEKEAEF